jgi:hypothetical protein
VVITDTEPERLAPLAPPAPMGLRGELGLRLESEKTDGERVAQRREPRTVHDQFGLPMASGSNRRSKLSKHPNIHKV